MRRAAVLLAALLPAFALAQAPPPAESSPKKPMTFRLVTSDPDAPPENQTRWIAASGALMPETGQAFEAFARANAIDGLTIWFDSAGGSILGGIRLGDALRKANARVAIGRSTPVGEQKDSGERPPRHQLLPGRGICYSSCAYAFLGGRTRLIHPGAGYGVHMFWPGDQLDGILSRSYRYADIERAQRISANLAAYIQRVGGDLQLLQIASATPPRGAIRRLTPREIVTLKVAALAIAEPQLAGAGNWGVALEQKQARLVTSAEARTPDGIEFAYALEAGCSGTPGFHDIRFEMAPKKPLKGDQPLAFRRIILASASHDGVLAFSGKDIVATPPAFPRRTSDHPNLWIGAAGSVQDAILNEAARPADALRLRIEDGAARRFEVAIPAGNLPRVYENWTSACARIARGGNAVP